MVGWVDGWSICSCLLSSCCFFLFVSILALLGLVDFPRCLLSVYFGSLGVMWNVRVNFCGLICGEMSIMYDGLISKKAICNNSNNITRACGFTKKITNDEVVSDFV